MDDKNGFWQEKKQKIYEEADPIKKQKYLEELEKLSNEDGSNIIYIDEAGIDKCPYREYARSLKGEKVVGEISGLRHVRTNIVAGYSRHFKKLFAPKTSKGFTNTDTFYNWLKDNLLPEMQLFSFQTGIKNFVLVLDNASFHKAKKIEELIESFGFKILFLSPYSPDLNPIEHQWWVLKLNLARIRIKVENFWDTLNHELWWMSKSYIV